MAPVQRVLTRLRITVDAGQDQVAKSPIGGQRPTKVLWDDGRSVLLLDHPE